MSIELFWENDEQSVFLVEFDGKWTWEEWDAVADATQQFLYQRETISGAILNLNDGLNIPVDNIFNREGFDHFKQLLTINDSKYGKGPLVIVGTDSAIKAIFDAIAKLDEGAMQDVYFVPTIAEARAIMQQSAFS